jgi:hypothetical protein
MMNEINLAKFETMTNGYNGTDRNLLADRHTVTLPIVKRQNHQHG